MNSIFRVISTFIFFFLLIGGYSISTFAISQNESSNFFSKNTNKNNSLSDSSLAKVVISKIDNNEITKNTKVNIAVSNGMVILDGIADSYAQADELIALSFSTPGISDVITDTLSIKNSTQPISDTVITGKLKGLLIKQKLDPNNQDISLLTVNINTNNGIVYLTGSVNNEQQIQKVIELAKSIKNVKDVKSNLVIKNN